MKKNLGLILVIIGILFAMFAPYVPDVLFRAVLAYNYRYYDSRFVEIIPSIRIGGIMIFLCGLVLWLKKGVKK